MDRVGPVTTDKTQQLIALLKDSLDRLAARVDMGVALYSCAGSLIDSRHWPRQCQPPFSDASGSICFSSAPHPKATAEPSMTRLNCTAGYSFLSAPILSDQNQCATLLIGPFLLSSPHAELEPNHDSLCSDIPHPPEITTEEEPWLRGLIETSAELIGLKMDALTEARFNEKLQESHEQLQGFFEAAPLGLLVSKNRAVVKANKKFFEITGYSPQELFDSNGRIFYESDQEYERVYRELSQCMWSGEPKAHIETKCGRKDGSIRDIALYTAPLNPRDPQGGAAVVVQDITQKKLDEEALRVSRDRLHSLFQAVPVGLAIIRDRHFYSVNEQMAIITGYDTDELILMHVRQLYATQDAYQQAGKALYATLWENGRTDLETKLLRKDGKIRDLHVSLTPLNPHDKTAGVAASCMDITEQKLNDRALKHQRGMLQSLFNAVPVGLAIVKSRTFAAVNKPLAEMLGYTSNEILNVSTRKFYLNNEEFYRIRIELYEALWSTGKHHYVETQLLCADGTIREVSLTAAAITPGDPEAGAAVAVYDLTEQKRTKLQLQKNEERFRTIADFTGQILYEYDLQNNTLIWSGRTEEMTGYEQEELNRRGFDGWIDQLHPDDRVRVSKQLEEATQNNQLFQCAYQLRRADGTYIHVEEEGVCFYDEDKIPLHMVGIIRDITSRVEAQEKLIESENRYRTLFDSAGNAIFVLFEHLIVDCNQQALELFDCAREDLLGKTVFELSPVNQPDGISSQEKISHIRQQLTTGSLQKFEWCHRRANGKSFEVEVYINPITVAEKNCLHVSMRDITDRKLAEKALRESEFRFRSFYNTNPAGIILLDFDGIVLDTNKAFLRDSGYQLEQCVGHHIQEFVQNEEDQTQVVQAIVSLKAGIVRSLPLELTYHDAKGQVIPVSAKGWLVVDHDSAPMYIGVFIKNLSVEKALSREKAALEKQIIQAQKSEAIGTLAGGIAHDFNNILGGLIGYSELALLKMDPADTSDTRKYLGRVLEIGHRAKDLVQQILRFSRHSTTQFEPISLIPLVKESVRLLRSTLPSTIAIKQHLAINDDQILGDATQMHQVLMNLATNGSHAMRKNGGTLTISLKQSRLEQCKRFLTMEIPPGEYLLLRVEDTGTGMPESVLERIFEPYFTTKEVNEGTGLGLAVTLGIIKGHKGLIEVETKPDVGTCFTLYLPSTRSQDSQQQIDNRRLALGHGERILVVDDEEYFREVIREGLSLLGYTVEVQPSSLQTLEILTKNHQDYDLLITDQTMPEMTGTQLAQQVRALRPSLPILLCTGFSETITEENASRFGIAQLLLKPINIEEMATAVHTIFAANKHHDPTS